MTLVGDLVAGPWDAAELGHDEPCGRVPIVVLEVLVDELTEILDWNGAVDHPGVGVEVRHRLFGLGDVEGPDVELSTDDRQDLDAKQVRSGWLLAPQTLPEADSVGPCVGNNRGND